MRPGPLAWIGWAMILAFLVISIARVASADYTVLVNDAGYAEIRFPPQVDKDLYCGCPAKQRCFRRTKDGWEEVE